MTSNRKENTLKSGKGNFDPSLNVPSQKTAKLVKSLNNLSKKSKEALKNLPKFDSRRAEETYKHLKAQEYLDESSLSSNSLDPGFLKERDFDDLGPYQYRSDKSTYKGSYVNGKREGVGISITLEGDVYQGSWVNDVPHGYGRFVQFNGDSYEGDFHYGYPEGEGKLIYFNTKIVFQGGIIKGLKHGRGEEEYPDGSRYEGKRFKSHF